MAYKLRCIRHQNQMFVDALKHRSVEQSHGAAQKYIYGRWFIGAWKQQEKIEES